jgi:hypothetical protein
MLCAHTAIVTIIEGQFEVFQRFSSSKLVLKTVGVKLRFFAQLAWVTCVYMCAVCTVWLRCILVHVVTLHTYIHIHIYTYIYIYIYIYIYGDADLVGTTYIHTYTCVHAYIHTYIHIHVYTHAVTVDNYVLIRTEDIHTCTRCIHT